MLKILRTKCSYQEIIKPMIYRYYSNGKAKRKFEGIIFQRPVPESRFNEVVNHMRNHFYVNEPLLDALKLCKAGDPQPEMDEYCIDNLKEGLSIAALDAKTDKIIGVAMNGVKRSSDPDFQQRLDTMNGKIKLIFELLHKSNLHLDLFCRYGTDEIYEFRLLSVDSNYFGRGLAKELLLRSDNLGKESGYKLTKADCTGFYSQKIVGGLGFKKVHQIKYSCYRDKQRKVIFNTAPPHDSLAVMVKQYVCENCEI